MGYTHYYTVVSGTNVADPIIDKAWKKAIRACRKIIKNSPVPLGDGLGEKGSKPILQKGITFNGIEDDGHDTFSLPAKADSLWFDQFLNSFCKTDRKPYDMVVTACLCALNHYMGEAFCCVGSDGEPGEWEKGRKLAQDVLGTWIRIPWAVLRMDHYIESYREKYLEEHPEYVREAEEYFNRT